MRNISMNEKGFEGILYPGDGSKDKAVIVVSGSNGGMGITRKEAKFYDRNGIPSLALALFKTKETNKDLDRVPLEYAENAIRFLKEEGYRKIGIDGMSKGSEFALIAASMFPDISFVIARVPSYFVSEGLSGSGKSKKPSGTSCWSYQGHELPYAPYHSRKFDLIKTILKEKELHIITFNRDKDITPESIIPVEKINGPILLLSSTEDEVWPSCESAVYIENRLKEKGFNYPVRHIAYDYMSHAMLTELSPVLKLAFITERKNPKECEEERKDLRKELISFITAEYL
ncbi:MAG: hypothetical protein IKS54_07320 [Erysipelotrichaceae bacterium]|nr:hypothetical protein [Erysipelotrichaceae bacterium]